MHQPTDCIFIKHVTLCKILVTPNVTRHLTSAKQNCSICVCVYQPTYESLYTSSILSVGMLNIYIGKDIGKTIDGFDSISDLRQPIKFSSFLCGMKIC